MASLSFAEALTAAVKVEEAGMAFYRAAAASAIDPASAEVFLGLAEFERKHQEYFAGLARRVPSEPAMFGGGPEGEFARDLAEMAETGVFDAKKGPAALFEGRESPAAVIKTALGLEKDSIVFYLGLQKAMANREEALKVSEIIDEELRHVSVLNNLLRQMK